MLRAEPSMADGGQAQFRNALRVKPRHYFFFMLFFMGNDFGNVAREKDESRNDCATGRPEQKLSTRGA